MYKSIGGDRGAPQSCSVGPRLPRLSVRSTTLNVRHVEHGWGGRVLPVAAQRSPANRFNERVQGKEMKRGLQLGRQGEVLRCCQGFFCGAVLVVAWQGIRMYQTLCSMAIMRFQTTSSSKTVQDRHLRHVGSKKRARCQRREEGQQC